MFIKTQAPRGREHTYRASIRVISDGETRLAVAVVRGPLRRPQLEGHRGVRGPAGRSLAVVSRENFVEVANFRPVGNDRHLTNLTRF